MFQHLILMFLKSFANLLSRLMLGLYSFVNKQDECESLKNYQWSVMLQPHDTKIPSLAVRSATTFSIIQDNFEL